MASRIPVDYLNAIRLLASIGDDEFQGAHTALQNADKFLELEDIAELLAKTGSIERDSANALVEFLMSLHLQLGSEPEHKQTLVNSICASFRRQEKNVTEVQVQRLTERLGKLLESVTPIQLRAKLIEVMSAQQRLLREGRIFTDVRPIFSSAEEVGTPEGAVVLHTLRLRFYEDGAVKSWYVCLDDSDLDNLQKQIERARHKSTELTDVLLKAEIRQLNK